MPHSRPTILPTILAALLATLYAPPVRADACGGLVDRVAAAAKAEIGSRTDNFATFRVNGEITLTLACGGADPSSVGAQYRGVAPPEAYVTAFAEAAHVLTGIDRGILADAVRRAAGEAAQRRHGVVPAGRVLVTCAVKKSAAEPAMLCAAIDKGDRQ